MLKINQKLHIYSTLILVVIKASLTISGSDSAINSKIQKFEIPACENLNNTTNEPLIISDILQKGQNLYGDFSEFQDSPSPFPCWFDPELARIGQRFASKYQAQVSLAHLLSLIMLLGNAQVRQVMYATRRSETPKKAFKRYTATGLHVGIWYNVDILNPTWLKSVQTIRQIHKGVAVHLKSMNKNKEFEKPLVTKESNPTGFYPDEKMWTAFNLDLEAAKQQDPRYHKFLNINLNSNLSAKNNKTILVHKPTELYNQYLMSITQWSFVALPILVPEKLGIPQWTELELRGFYHLWAVISHVLGIKDEFILCKNPKDFQGCKKVLNDVFQTYIIPSVFDIDFQGQMLIEALLRAPRVLVPSTPVDFMLVQILEDILEIPTPHMYSIAPWQTRIGRFFAKHFTEPFFHWPMVQKISNFILAGEIQVASKKTYGDPGTDLSSVAERTYILER